MLERRVEPLSHNVVTVPSTLPPAPIAGTWIRGWRLDRLIHVGKTACVYRAKSDAGIVGALKALRPTAVSHRTAAERFAREISALQGLTHPAIPRLLDHGIDDDGLPWFATEWIVGWDLETHRIRSADACQRRRCASSACARSRHFLMRTRPVSSIAISSRRICSSAKMAS